MWPAVCLSRSVVLSPAISDSANGDGVARNLQQNGIAVTVFSRQTIIAAGFPDVKRKVVWIPEICGSLSGFDRVIQMHRNKPFAGLEYDHPRTFLLDHICRVRSSLNGG